MRALPRLGVAAMLLAAPLLVATPCFAQSEAARSEAVKRYQDGVALHEKGREEEAYLRFAQAYVVVQTPNILFNLARTEQLTGRHVSAAEHFRAYIGLPEHPRVTKALRAKAQEYLTQLDAQLGHVALDAPAGAVLRVDGQGVATAATIDVEPGAHAIEARLGEQVGTVDVVAVAGATVPARVVFDGPKAVGTVVAAPVVVVTPDQGAALPPPQHTQGADGSVSTTGNVVRWSLSGLAVVGIGMGVGFGLESSSKADDVSSFRASHPCASRSSNTCSQYSQLQSDQRGSATVAVASYAAGGALAVGAVATWLFWPKRPSGAASIAIVPEIGRGTAGLSLTSSF